jgi:hypothetical protein
MNSIRALNVRTAIEGSLRSYPDPGPDIRAVESGIAPIKSANHAAANESTEALISTAENIP